MGDESKSSVVVGSPVTRTPTDDPAEKHAEGVALCLSGGGCRAMVFHLGSQRS